MTRYVFGAAGSRDRSAWDAAGGGAADIVAAVLRSQGFKNVFTSPPSVRRCADPIVVTCGGWERFSRQVEEVERGMRHVDVLVCCEDPRDAEATACSAERDLRRADWTGATSGWHMRVVSVDTDAPVPRGRDGSGRWLRGFSASLTIARDFDE
ncbi:hypothetical protein [Rubneribacter badeniensis]|uniref:hypothetical protein n=1 Tax=Rubneribacter badeniensis TaxID=2070688 RepID=UPI003A8D3168